MKKAAQYMAFTVQDGEVFRGLKDMGTSTEF